MAMQLRGKGITLEKVLVPSDPAKRKTKVRTTPLTTYLSHKKILNKSHTITNQHKMPYP